MKTDKRKLKRKINRLHREMRVGMYFEDCRFHPCVVTESNLWRSDLFGSGVTGKSLVTGTECSCSFLYCGPAPLSKTDAEARAEYMKAHGLTAYMVKYHNIDATEFEALNDIWSFEGSWEKIIK